MIKKAHEVTRDDVIAQMLEFRRDSKAFFARHSAGPSIRWDLLDDDGRRYPPAAIFQAAAGWDDARGGAKAPDSAGQRLRALDFRVVEKIYPPSSTRSELESLAKKLEEIGITEEEIYGKRRVRANVLREFSIRSRGCCEVSGVADRALLRVSHIVAWKEDENCRLNPENVILLSGLWDAAFDRGLVSFTDDGVVIYSKELSELAKAALRKTEARKIILTEARKQFLSQHRTKYGLG